MKLLSKLAKYWTLCLLVMLASTILMASVNAQDAEQYPAFPNLQQPPTPPPAPSETAIAVIVAAVGGTTDPAAGTYTYNYADTISITATPDSGYRFLYWVISGAYTPGHNIPPIIYPTDIQLTDPNFVPDFPSPSTVAYNNLVVSTNPLNIICGYGYTYVYQPVFTPTAPTPGVTTGDAVVVVLDSIGGSTNPGPGTYYYTDGTTISLTATPDSGYEFVTWVAVGEENHPTTFTDNPTAITCGYGYTYDYQAMFEPTGTTTTTTEGIPALYFYVIVIVLVIIAIIGIGAAIMYRGRSK